jgi:hypothetical protein
MRTSGNGQPEITLGYAAAAANVSPNFARSKAREGAIESRALGNGMRLTKVSQIAVLRRLKADAIKRRGRRAAEALDATRT